LSNCKKAPLTEFISGSKESRLMRAEIEEKVDEKFGKGFFAKDERADE